MFGLNALTALTQSHITDSNFLTTDAVLAPRPVHGPAFYGDSFIGNFFPSLSVTGSNSADQLALIGNTYNGRMTVAGGPWFNLSSVGDVVSGEFTNTATGNVAVVNGIYGTLNQIRKVGNLPPCNASERGFAFNVSDASAPSHGAELRGGGRTLAIALCNGSSWEVH